MSSYSPFHSKLCLKEEIALILSLLGEYLDEAIKLIVCHHEQKQA